MAEEKNLDNVESEFVKDMTDLFGPTFVRDLLQDDDQFQRLLSLYIKGVRFGAMYVSSTFQRSIDQATQVQEVDNEDTD